MSTTFPVSVAHSRAATPACPNCESSLQQHGDGHLHYWSCRSCNLVFLA